MDNPEKLATYGTQNEDKQSKNTTQYVLDTTISLVYHMLSVYLTPPHFIEVPVSSQECQRPCIWVRYIDFAFLYGFDI